MSAFKPISIQTDKALVVLKKHGCELYDRPSASHSFFPILVTPESAKAALKTISEANLGKKLSKCENAISALVQTAFPQQVEQDFLFVGKFVNALLALRTN